MKGRDSFSKRTERIRVSATYQILAEAERLRAQGVSVMDLGPGEPDFPTPAHVKAAGIRAIESNLTKYTSTPGVLPLREAIARQHAQKFGSHYSAPETIVSVGAKQALFNALAALVDHDDEVILPVPYYLTFLDLITYHGGRPVFVPTHEQEGFKLKAEAVERAVSPRTKLIILNSPNNPSGAVIPEREFRKIAALAIEHHLFVLTDEAYSDFLYEDARPFSIASVGEALKPRLVVVGTLSKSYAMTGWRIGYALGPERLIQRMLSIQSHCTSNPTSISQYAALEAIEGTQASIPIMQREFARRREFVLKALQSMAGIQCAPPQGSFFVYPNVSAFYGKSGISNSTDFAKALLERARIMVIPGEVFGTSAHVRVSYAAPIETLERAMSAFQDFLSSLQ